MRSIRIATPRFWRKKPVSIISGNSACLVTIVRPFNVYGPGQNRRFLIPTILHQAIDPGQAAIVVADLRPRRDYIFIADLIDLLVRTAFRREGGIFNAGSGSSWGVGEVIAMVNGLLPVPKPVHANGPIRPDEVIDVIADISRARHEFGWEPQVTLRDGLLDTLAVAMSRGER